MTVRWELDAGGRTRSALAFMPPGAEPVPLVIMLHGAGATAAIAAEQTGWVHAAERDGYAVIFPEGTRPDPARPPEFRRNPQTWNDGSGRGHTGRLNVDDVGFVAAIIDEALRRRAIDLRRVYLAGFSNGASLAFRAAAELARRVAAVGAVSGHCWVSPSRLERPVPLLYLIGGADALNPVDGGEVDTPWGQREYHPPVRQSLERWASACGCQAMETLTTGSVTTMTYDCRSEMELEACIVAGLGHVWPGGPRLLPERIVGPRSDALQGTDTLWRFFSRHRLPA